MVGVRWWCLTVEMDWLAIRSSVIQEVWVILAVSIALLVRDIPVLDSLPFVLQLLYLLQEIRLPWWVNLIQTPIMFSSPSGALQPSPFQMKMLSDSSSKLALWEDSTLPFTVYKELPFWICLTVCWSTLAVFPIRCSPSPSPTTTRATSLRLTSQSTPWILSLTGGTIDFMQGIHYNVCMQMRRTDDQSLMRVMKAYSHLDRSLRGIPSSHFVRKSQNLTTRHRPSTSMISNLVQNSLITLMSLSPSNLNRSVISAPVFLHPPINVLTNSVPIIFPSNKYWGMPTRLLVYSLALTMLANHCPSSSILTKTSSFRSRVLSQMYNLLRPSMSSACVALSLVIWIKGYLWKAL